MLAEWLYGHGGKRLWDLVGAGLSLALAALPLAVCMVLIRRGSPRGGRAALPAGKIGAVPARRSADLGPWGPQVGASMPPRASTAGRLTSGTRAAGALGPAPTNGPALLGQWRIGRHGRPFRLWKLRTMRADAEPGGRPRFAAPADARLTPIGAWLRAWHGDELPQLWNVLRGEMALVGPRPERPDFVARFRRAIPGYDRRHLLRPGLTGWAQVNLGYAAGLEGTRAKTRYGLSRGSRRFACWQNRRGPSEAQRRLGAMGSPSRREHAAPRIDSGAAHKRDARRRRAGARATQDYLATAGWRRDWQIWCRTWDVARRSLRRLHFQQARAAAAGAPPRPVAAARERAS
ncbi:MAG TPA: sugar transferase [Terriglobales bacterium]|nr:sugar transferase [Terriglobales bacterium]